MKASLIITVSLCIGIIATFAVLIVLQSKKQKQAPINQQKEAPEEQLTEKKTDSAIPKAAPVKVNEIEQTAPAKTFDKLTEEQSDHYEAQLKHASKFSHNVGALRPVRRLDAGMGVMSMHADGLTLMKGKQYKPGCQRAPMDRDLLRLERGSGNMLRYM